jgi:predicted ATP-binding protein involved in virulence
VDGHTSSVTLLAQLLTGPSPTLNAQIWDLLDEFGDPIRRDYWLHIEVHQIAVPMPSASTARVIERLMEVANWDAARTAAIVLKEPATTAQRLRLLRRARESVQNDDGTRYREAMLWAELWDKIEPHGAEETLLARQEETAWMRALRETHYRLRFVPPWITDDPQAFVELATSPHGRFLPRLWQGWPGDKLPSEAAHECLYNWARAALSHSQSSKDPEAVSALLVQIMRRPRGTDGLWPGDALRQLLEEEYARGEDALFKNLSSHGRVERSHEPRAVSELAKQDLDLAEDCERSARELALRWPRTAALCHELAAQYREKVAGWQERITMWNERDGLVSPSENVEPLFPLTELQVENFRGIGHAILFPLHSRLNVLYGRNASGKSTLLEALRIGLAALVPKLPPNISEKIGELPAIHDRDRRISTESQEPAPYVRITLSGQRHQDEPLVWQVERDYARGAEAQDRETASLAPYFEALNERLGSGDPHAPLPVFAFYGPLRVPSSKAEEPATPSDERRTRADGLADALKGVASFEPGTDWFRREWFKELQERSEQPGYESPPLRAIRQALAATLMTPEGVGIKNPRIAKGTLLFIVDFVRPGQKDLKLEIGQLSDGFRTLLMVVIDLMRRIAECNPPFPDERDPAERWRNTPAVVLIDEVDAHLHPSWQKTVLHGLLAAFPRSQFFVTTHSPLILAAEHDAITWLLEDGKVSQVGQTYGKTPDVILEDYQGTSLRPVQLQKRLDNIREALQRSDFDGAQALITEIEMDPVVDPELADLVALRTRLQLMRERALRTAAPTDKRPS